MKSPSQSNNTYSFSFQSENPIESIDEDTDGLNRNNFSKNLAENIKNYFKNNNNSITIGLMGDWGSGKTSILNLTKIHLKDSDIKIMDFNPWIYSSYNQLIEQFFDELISQFTEDTEHTLIKELKSYNFKLNKSNFVKSILPTIASIGNSHAGEILNQTLNMDNEEKSLEKIKNRINEELKNHQILCIIDDLDRLDTHEINEMFKLIKIMANFDNIIYIMAFDKNRISEALNTNYSDKFIEKIINVPLEVPLISNIELENILMKKLDILSKKHNIFFEDIRFDPFINSDYLYSETEGLISFFKNIRDIKRFINVLEFNIELIKNEVDFVDFIVITAIQLFKPKIYEKIKHNESLLVRKTISLDEYPLYPEIALKEQKEFENIVEDDETIKYILQMLFPKMELIYETKYVPDDPETNSDPIYESRLSICHKNHFKTYFKLDTLLKEISEYEISITIDLINSKKENETTKQFNNFKEMNKLNLFIRRLNNRIDQIKEPIFLLTLLSTFDEKIFNIFPLENIYYQLICEIKNNRFKIIKNEFNNINNLDFLYKLITHIENNNIIEYYEHDEIILSEREINELKEIILEKFKIMLKTQNEYAEENIIGVIKLGTQLELNAEVDNFINELISTKIGLLILLNSFISSKSERFYETEIQKMSDLIVDLNIIKQQIDKHYEEIKDKLVVKKFLKGYELWLDDIID